MQKLKRKPLATQLERIYERLLALTDRALSTVERLPRWLTMVVLIVLSAGIFFSVSGCSPRIVRPPLPPQADARTVTPFTGATYRDVTLYAIETRTGWLSCEQDKSAIRQVYRR